MMSCITWRCCTAPATGSSGTGWSLEELRRYNADNGLLYVNTVGELVDLFEATRFAAQEISRRMVEG